MKKVTFILSFLAFTSFLFTLLQSCNKCGDNAGPYDFTYFNLDSIAPIIKKIVGTSGSKETMLYFIVDNIPANENPRYDSLVIEPEYKFEEIKNKIVYRNSLGISSAYACDPAPIPYDYDDVEKVIITSSENYNDTLTIGYDLSKIVYVHRDNLFYGQDINSFVRQTSFLEYPVFFTFSIPPKEDKFHNLNIKYILTDSSIVSTTINNILIRK